MVEGYIMQNRDSTESQLSVPFLIGDATTFSIHVDFDNNAYGEIGILVCNQIDGNYAPLANGSTTITDCNPFHLTVYGAGYKFIKLKWTPNDGNSGDMEAYIVVKHVPVRQV